MRRVQYGVPDDRRETVWSARCDVLRTFSFEGVFFLNNFREVFDFLCSGREEFVVGYLSF